MIIAFPSLLDAFFCCCCVTNKRSGVELCLLALLDSLVLKEACESMVNTCDCSRVSPSSLGTTLVQAALLYDAMMTSL